MATTMKEFLTGMLLVLTAVSASAEPCDCGPVEDISLLPENPTVSDVLTARAAIRDFNIVDQDAGVIEVDALNKVIDLTVVTTDTVGNDTDQVQFYPIGQLPAGRYTFNLFIAGLNPPPPTPPGPQLVFTTTVEISGLPSASVPILDEKGIALLIISIALLGGLALRSAIR